MEFDIDDAVEAEWDAMFANAFDDPYYKPEPFTQEEQDE